MNIVLEYDRLAVALLNDVQPDVVVTKETTDFPKCEISILVRIAEFRELPDSERFYRVHGEFPAIHGGNSLRENAKFLEAVAGAKENGWRFHRKGGFPPFEISGLKIQARTSYARGGRCVG